MWFKITDLVPHLRMRGITRRRDVSIIVTEEGTDNHDTAWGGGSRRVLSYLNLKTGKCEGGIPTCSAFHGKPQDVPMQPGYAILDCGTFCGKPSFPTLYIHPDDVAQILGKELVSVE